METMNMMYTFALAIAAITGINPKVGLLSSKPGTYFFGYALRAAVIGVVMALIYYFGTPALVGPFWGTTTWILLGLGINTAITLLVAGFKDGAFDSYGGSSFKELGFRPGILLVPAVFLLIVGFRGCAGTSIWTAEERYDIVGDVQEGDAETLKPLSLDHIRVVAQEQASWKGDKVIADSGASLGSKFHPGTYNAQRVGDKLYWVSFLQYNAFRHWQASEGGTPGFIMVSAEDIQRSGELITENDGAPLKLRYVESGYFGDNLERHVYLSGYQGYKILDIHREVDDELKPNFVITLGSPTQHYSVDKIDLVLIVDPQTGEIEEHTVEDVPAWVDRVYPAALVADYLEWWGAYHSGWWNSFWGKDEVVKPTESNGRSLRLVWGADGQCYWFTGVTSVATSDQALVSFVLVNCRNGQVTEYRTSGIDESAALDAVNSAISNFGNWHGSDCVLYHLYGEWAYIVPVLDDKGIFQRLAVVRLENGQVALGKTRQEAMREFQLLQTQSGRFNPQDSTELKQLTVKITRAYGDVQDGRTVYYIETEQTPGKVLTGTSQLSPFLPNSTVGDWAKVGILDSDANEIPMQSFQRTTAPAPEQE